MSKILVNILLLIAFTVTLATTQAEASRVCTMQNANVDKRRIKTYSGKIIEQWDEEDTPAMQGNECVSLWCRAQCDQNEKCKRWAYLAVRGGKTTCTLYSNAKTKNAACSGNVCDSEYGKCTGKYDDW